MALVKLAVKVALALKFYDSALALNSDSVSLSSLGSAEEPSAELNHKP